MVKTLPKFCPGWLKPDKEVKQSQYSNPGDPERKKTTENETGFVPGFFVVPCSPKGKNTD